MGSLSGTACSTQSLFCPSESLSKSNCFALLIFFLLYDDSGQCGSRFKVILRKFIYYHNKKPLSDSSACDTNILHLHGLEIIN